MELTLKVEFSDDVKDFLTELLGGKKETAKEATAKTAAKGGKKKDPVEDDDNDLLNDDDSDDAPIYTVERVREKCQQLIQDGKAAKLKALLAEFDVAKVVNLQPGDFNAFMTKANKIK
jgi:hypothetical protein